jgi:hypothetical protein
MLSPDYGHNGHNSCDKSLMGYNPIRERFLTLHSQ